MSRVSKVCNRLFSLARVVQQQQVTTPRRALLYVPGTDERKITKAATELDADCVCMDCEDAVALNRKENSRHTIKRLLSRLDFGRSERVVRINAPGSQLADDDLLALLEPEPLEKLHALVVPKVNSADDISWLYDHVLQIAGHHLRHMDNPPALITMCETPRGLLNLRSIFESALDSQAPLRLEGCIFGGDDFAAAIGATRTRDSRELLFARQSMVVHCKALGLQAIDIVKTDFKDDSGLVLESQEGSILGFTGKQVIHPNQVAIVQEAFSPDPQQIAAAKELIAAFEAHQESGIGAFTFHHHMIDMPTVLQAKNLLDLAAAIGRS